MYGGIWSIKKSILEWYKWDMKVPKPLKFHKCVYIKCLSENEAINLELK